MKSFTFATLTAIALSGALVSSAQALELKSPDGKVVVNFDLKEIGAGKGCPVYQVAYAGRPVLGDSRLGLELAGAPFNSGFRISEQKASTADSTWEPLAGESKTVRDHYNQLALELEETAAPGRILQVIFRAYDHGVAFCYKLPEQKALSDFRITRETTQFSFTADHTAWAVYSAQGNYDPADPRRQPKNAKTGPVLLSELIPGVERPLTVRLADDAWAAVTEARLVDYARMKLRPSEGAAHTLEAFLDAERNVNGEVVGKTPFSSPWRVLMLANSPGKLLEQNDIILNLNDPCAIADTSWIKPGKVIREVTLTTVGGKACIDFAVKNGLQFILYDAGWYGHEYDQAADARDVHLDPKRNPVPDSLNLHEVIEYGKSKGIGVILYVNQIALTKQLDEILPLYEKWGVKGVKYGFVHVGSQKATAWLHEAIRKAAKHHLMVDIHDEFRSTGFERTYPNLMTVEGISGNEAFPTPTQNAVLPFTRYLTGAADYTFCWNDGRLKVTKAHQLALSTLYFSPWQFLYWYDRPAGIKDEPALEYWKLLPTAWDETRVVAGDIGRRAVIARRRGDAWFLGAISPGDGKFDIPLSFLAPGRKYLARIHSDPPDGKGVRIEERTVDSNSMLPADMPPNGGVVVHFSLLAP